MDNAAARPVGRPLPRELYKSPPYQNGITDPMWPASYDEAVAVPAPQDAGEQPLKTEVVAPAKDVDDTEEAVRQRYAVEYAGRVARQDFMTLLRADVSSRDRDELRDILKLITEFIVEEIEKGPSDDHVGVLESIPRSYRVTITLGLGATLFVDRSGQDRFGIRARRPKFLKTMPSLPGDEAGFVAEDTGSDLIFVISSDHPYVNTAVARFFGEYFNKRFSKRHHGDHPRPVLRFRGAEQGFGRKDRREFLRFDDGIQNLQMDREELERLVYVAEGDGEPRWCTHGSYMVYRKIREAMTDWEALGTTHQEKMIGREKTSGLPLSRERRDAGDMTPVFADPIDPADGPLNAHIRKVQPRRKEPDLFGVDDLERRFLRRPYPFFDGIEADGHSVNGLQFVAFMKSIQQQFEHVTNMWQMNPDFPVPGTGIDALYAAGILSTIDGGYYFCPPGAVCEDDFLGSGLFT